MSWTDDLEIAAYFAHPYPDWLAGVVLTAEVSRWRLMAYFQEKGEHEVVIDPRGIRYQRHPMSLAEAVQRADDGHQRLEHYARMK